METSKLKLRGLRPIRVIPSILILIIASISLAAILIAVWVWFTLTTLDYNYTDADKKPADLNALLPHLIATLTLLGGALTWFIARNEKIKNSIADPAKTKLVTHYNLNDYTYQTKLILEPGQSIYNVVVFTEFTIPSRKRKERAVQADLEQFDVFTEVNQSRTIKVTDLGIKYEEAGALQAKTIILYKSNNSYWKLDSSKSRPVRIKPPSKKAQQPGTLGYLNNTAKDTKGEIVGTYYAYIKIQDHNEERLIKEPFKKGEEIKAASSLYEQTKKMLDHYGITDETTFTGRVMFGDTEEFARDGAITKQNTRFALYVAASELIHSAVTPRINLELFKQMRPLVVDYLFNPFVNDQEVENSFITIQDFYNLSLDYKHQTWLPLISRYQEVFAKKPSIQDVLIGWQGSCKRMINHSNYKNEQKQIQQQLSIEPSNLAYFELFVKHLDLATPMPNDTRLALNKVRERVREMTNHDSIDRIVKGLDWVGDN